MSYFRVFSRIANPAIDQRLYKLSPSRAKAAIASGEVEVIEEYPFALRVARATRGEIHAAGEVEVVDRTRDCSDTSLTLRTMEANAGIAGRRLDPPDVAAIRRAQAKVKFWGQRASWADRVVTQ